MTLAAASMVLLFQISCMDLDRAALEDEALTSGDGYTWLALVDEWRETGQWSPVVPAHNAPHGLETHLTMPFAAFVRGLAQPLRLSLAPTEADRIAGRLSGPLLHVASAIALAWGSRALLGTGGAILVVVGFLFMPVATLRFDVRQFDHHGLHLFLTALIVALLLHRESRRDGGGGMAGCAGVIAGVGVWSGTEMLVPAGIGGLALGLAWVAWGGEWRSRGLWLYTLGMAIALTAAVVVEHPVAQWKSLALDRVSGAHVLVGALSTAATGGVALFQGHWPNISAAGRAGAGVLAACSVAATTWATVPDFLLGPYGVPDPVVAELLQGLILDQGAFVWLVSAPGFLGFQACLAVVVVVKVIVGLRSTSRRDAWLLIGIGLLAGAAFAFVQLRLSHYYEMYACVALGAGAAGAGRFVWRRAPKIARLAAGPVVLVVLVWPFLGSIIGSRYTPASVHPSWETAALDRACDWEALGRALARLPSERPGTIATYAAPGPELAHFSGRGAVATGCHCNAEGMRDARTILLEMPASARAVAERRRVEFVVQCSSASGWQGHAWYVERSGPDGVYARLERGQPPNWLVPVPASEIGVDQFAVWRTKFERP